MGSLLVVNLGAGQMCNIRVLYKRDLYKEEHFRWLENKLLQLVHVNETGKNIRIFKSNDIHNKTTHSLNDMEEVTGRSAPIEDWKKNGFIIVNQGEYAQKFFARFKDFAIKKSVTVTISTISFLS